MPGEPDTVLFTLRNGWRPVAHGLWAGMAAGDESSVRRILERLPADGSAPDVGFEDGLARVGDGFFALAAQSPAAALACVDKTRSWPLFHAGEGGGLTVGNDARALAAAAGLTEVDSLSALELAMAGYVTGPDTLRVGLRQFQAGECLVQDRVAGRSRAFRYYCYDPRPKEAPEEDLMAGLAAATREACAKALALAGDRPVWVPLSGGLDSRLILAMFVELGFPRLQAFSYGLPGNHEARIARKVARRLGVPWMFHPVRRASARDWFRSPERRAYWEFSDGLCVVPFMQDAQVLGELLASGRMPRDAVVVNGQSGDYITGGHLPKVLAAGGGDQESLFAAMEAKHFALWTQLRTGPNRERLRAKARGLLGLEPGQAGDMAALHERWEWQERQSKYVIGGQRAYDFHGLAWDMPLWRDEYLRFWAGVPYRLKAGQALYRAWLTRWDPRGLFTSISTRVWRWPGWTMAVPALAQVVGLLGGRRRKESFYKYFKYIGHNADKYAAYSYRCYRTEMDRARNPLALFARTWLEENADGLPQ